MCICLQLVCMVDKILTNIARCFYRVRGGDGSCAKHLTVDILYGRHAANIHT